MASDSGKSETDAYREIAVRGDSDSDADGLDLHAPTNNDRGILEDEEQEEKLLLKEFDNGRTGELAERGLIDMGRRERRRNHRRQRRSKKRKAKSSMDEEGKLMYEMEEGGSKDDASSQSSSRSLDLDRPKQQPGASTKVCSLTIDSAIATDGRCSASATSSQHQYCSNHNDIVRPACFWVVQKLSQRVSKAPFTQSLQRNIDVCTHDHPHIS
jgi:hypothetical protein